MNILLSTTRTHVLCQANEGSVTKIPLHDALFAFHWWLKCYRQLKRQDSPGDLLAIGQMIFNWLKHNGAAEVLVSRTSVALRIRAHRVGDPEADDALECALLNVPWELLAGPDGHFAADENRLFLVSRQVGNICATEPYYAENSTLSMLFMSALPQRQSELTFEVEESRIRNIAPAGSLTLSVENGGSRVDFDRRIKTDGPFHAFHLSCHGSIEPARGRPQLALEDERAEADVLGPAEIASLFSVNDDLPSLVVLNVCRGAEVAQTRDAEPSVSFASALANAGVANVVGWHGSVVSRDGNDFFAAFYSRLVQGENVSRAAAKARTELLRSPVQGEAWHRARVYIGPGGGESLVDPELPALAFANAGWEEAFRCQGNEVWPVTAPGAFVGRRKPLKAALKALRGDQPGLLIHGMAGMGKTFLARRIASRMTGHKTVVVDKFDAKHIFDGVVAAWSPTHVIADHQKRSDALAGNPALLGQALEVLLEGPLAKPPILLVLEGLERIVDVPTASSAMPAIREEYRAALIGVLSAFAKAKSGSRLILTSRYRFVLPDDNGFDFASRLTRVSLPLMDAVERESLWFAVTGSVPANESDFPPVGLETEAGGHPGLHAAFIEMSPEIKAANATEEEMERKKWRAKAEEFIERVGLRALGDAMTQSQRRLLAIVGQFSAGAQIPRQLVEEIGTRDGAKHPAADLDRLLALGLVDEAGGEAIRANAVAGRLLDTADPADVSRWSVAALDYLDTAWRQKDGTYPKDERGVELYRLASAVRSPSANIERILDCAAAAAAGFPYRNPDDARRGCEEVLRPALDKLALPSMDLLRTACKTAVAAKLDPFWEDVVNRFAKAAVKSEDKAEASLYQARRAQHLADAHKQKGEAAAAMQCVDEAKEYFRTAVRGYEPLQYTRGGDWVVEKLANVHREFSEFLRSQADWVSALEVLEAQLNYYDALNDTVELAETAARIAEILECRCEFKRALTYRRNQAEALKYVGDTCGAAAAKEKLADNLVALRTPKGAGQALEILRELQETYRCVGDELRATAVQSKIDKLRS